MNHRGVHYTGALRNMPCNLNAWWIRGHRVRLTGCLCLITPHFIHSAEFKSIIECHHQYLDPEEWCSLYQYYFSHLDLDIWKLPIVNVVCLSSHALLNITQFNGLMRYQNVLKKHLSPYKTCAITHHRRLSTWIFRQSLNIPASGITFPFFI